MFEVDKYIVFKREDLERLIREVAWGAGGMSAARQIREAALPPDTTFVIRDKDYLGVSTLRSYVSNTLTLIEMAEAGLIALSDEQRENLLDIADGGAGMADIWAKRTPHKIPD